MRIVIAAVGKLKDGSERELYARYADRVAAAGRQAALGPVEVRELAEGRASGLEARMADEAARLLARCSDCTHRIVLDERGKALTSRQFADLLARVRDRGEPSLAFLIGGPDGHGTAAREAADTTLSLSAMTLPHGLARIVLAEQIYRAVTLLTGHPYHRG